MKEHTITFSLLKGTELENESTCLSTEKTMDRSTSWTAQWVYNQQHLDEGVVYGLNCSGPLAYILNCTTMKSATYRW